MKKNKLWIPITALVLALAVIAGVFLLPLLPKAEVAVFPVTMVGYTDFYSGTTESYGMVTTDKVQTHYLSGTQIMDIFRRLSQRGITIIMITHEQGIAQCADKTYHILDGRLYTDGIGQSTAKEAVHEEI